MTAPTKPPIDEQIAEIKLAIGNIEQSARGRLIPHKLHAILATLEAHKRITEAAGRPEPVEIIVGGLRGVEDTVLLRDYNRLLAYADRMAAKEKELRRRYAERWIAFSKMQERAETAERQLAECQKECEEQARLNGMGSEREARLMAQLAELQEKTERMAEPQNPCNCVPDGDDGTVAHLCHWHKTAFGKAYRMQNMANSLTVENIAKLPQDRLRLWIAHGIQESTARKRAEEQLAELQRKHDGLVARLREPSNKLLSDMMYAWEHSFGTPYTRYKSMLNVAVDAAMSAVALREGEK